MKHFLVFTLLSFISLVNTIVFAQKKDAVIGKINLIEKDNMLVIKAHITNNESFFIEGLSYNLVALKKNNSGNYSTNKEEGEFSLLANEKKSITELRINLNEDEEVKAYLFIKQNKILISKDSLLVLSKKKQQTQKKVVKESDFRIKGIVVEDVITKVGKDFYDYFYQNYSTSGSLYSFIINIKEKPYFGRSSIITVEINDNRIHEFVSKPDEEFLKSSVKISLQKINQFSIQQKILFKNNKY
ncbi:CsgE family curli-type amyloid fiber assembly protein [Polaribacter sp. PL03]|uniref:CsgE family curli-type amyloid fiber assembly protein n=1 Tax=Polaribacter sp. PL03 TaxID=3088353 RepID=UPI0029D22AC5|nr:CsgE family curli-type amyloid fiber assembly protein [Polaribacter sp. PL03]MDX6747623.1 CsgE family curli-type amyloid fiber assembly protein [Polaribacter sp. PL03]